MVGVVSLVSVPRLLAVLVHVIDLCEPDSTLAQSAGQQTGPSEVAVAIHFADMLWLAAKVECIGRFSLHVECHFHRLDLSFQRLVAFSLLGVQLV